MSMLIRYMTQTQQWQLLQAAKKTNCLLAQRDYHWMKLDLHTGMRVTELSLLERGQAEQALASGWLVTRPEQRKGGKRGHEYAVTQSVREALQALVMISRQLEQPGSGPAPLICAANGQPLSVRSFQVRLKLWVSTAKLDPRISMHWLRHSRAMNIIQRSRGGNPLKVAQIALGHVSLSSTGIYTQMAREDYVRELQQVDGQRLSKRDARRQAQQASGAQA